jgi:hypothetical protein
LWVAPAGSNSGLERGKSNQNFRQEREWDGEVLGLHPHTCNICTLLQVYLVIFLCSYIFGHTFFMDTNFPTYPCSQVLQILLQIQGDTGSDACEQCIFQ